MAVPSEQEADVHPLQQPVEQVQVRRERRLQEGLAGEDHQAHEITLPTAHELAQDLLGHRHPVAGLEVGGLHAARDIEDQHDVAGAEPDRLDPAGNLGPGQGEDEESQTTDGESGRQRAPPAPRGRRRAAEPGQGGKGQGAGGRARPIPYPKPGSGHQEKDQETRLSESHRPVRSGSRRPATGSAGGESRAERRPRSRGQAGPARTSPGPPR